jgi:hypothetical protein
LHFTGKLILRASDSLLNFAAAYSDFAIFTYGFEGAREHQQKIVSQANDSVKIAAIAKSFS